MAEIFSIEEADVKSSELENEEPVDEESLEKENDESVNAEEEPSEEVNSEPTEPDIGESPEQVNEVVDETGKEPVIPKIEEHDKEDIEDCEIIVTDSSVSVTDKEKPEVAVKKPPTTKKKVISKGKAKPKPGKASPTKQVKKVLKKKVVKPKPPVVLIDLTADELDDEKEAAALEKKDKVNFAEINMAEIFSIEEADVKSSEPENEEPVDEESLEKENDESVNAEEEPSEEVNSEPTEPDIGESPEQVNEVVDETGKEPVIPKIEEHDKEDIEDCEIIVTDSSVSVTDKEKPEVAVKKPPTTKKKVISKGKAKPKPGKASPTKQVKKVLKKKVVKPKPPVVLIDLTADELDDEKEAAALEKKDKDEKPEFQVLLQPIKSLEDLNNDKFQSIIKKGKIVLSLGLPKYLSNSSPLPVNRNADTALTVFVKLHLCKKEFDEVTSSPITLANKRVVIGEAMPVLEDAKDSGSLLHKIRFSGEESNKEPTSVFVNNIPSDTQPEILKMLFPAARNIQCPTLNGKSLGYAVLELSSRNDAEGLVKHHETYRAMIGDKVLKLHIVSNQGQKPVSDEVIEIDDEKEKCTTETTTITQKSHEDKKTPERSSKAVKAKSPVKPLSGERHSAQQDQRRNKPTTTGDQKSSSEKENLKKSGSEVKKTEASTKKSESTTKKSESTTKKSESTTKKSENSIKKTEAKWLKNESNIRRSTPSGHSSSSQANKTQGELRNRSPGSAEQRRSSSGSQTRSGSMRAPKRRSHSPVRFPPHYPRKQNKSSDNNTPKGKSRWDRPSPERHTTKPQTSRLQNEKFGNVRNRTNQNRSTQHASTASQSRRTDYARSEQNQRVTAGRSLTGLDMPLAMMPGMMQGQMVNNALLPAPGAMQPALMTGQADVRANRGHMLGQGMQRPANSTGLLGNMPAMGNMTPDMMVAQQMAMISQMQNTGLKSDQIGFQSGDMGFQSGDMGFQSGDMGFQSGDMGFQSGDMATHGHSHMQMNQMSALQDNFMRGNMQNGRSVQGNIATNMTQGIGTSNMMHLQANLGPNVQMPGNMRPKVEAGIRLSEYVGPGSKRYGKGSSNRENTMSPSSTANIQMQSIMASRQDSPMSASNQRQGTKPQRQSRFINLGFEDTPPPLSKRDMEDSRSSIHDTGPINPNFFSTSPEFQSRQPSNRSQSPGYHPGSLDIHQRSPEYRSRQPDIHERGSRSQNNRQRSPDYHSRSSNNPRLSPDYRSRSPNVHQRSPDPPRQSRQSRNVPDLASIRNQLLGQLQQLETGSLSDAAELVDIADKLKKVQEQQKLQQQQSPGYSAPSRSRERKTKERSTRFDSERRGQMLDLYGARGSSALENLTERDLHETSLRNPHPAIPDRRREDYPTQIPEWRQEDQSENSKYNWENWDKIHKSSAVQSGSSTQTNMTTFDYGHQKLLGPQFNELTSRNTLESRWGDSGDHGRSSGYHSEERRADYRSTATSEKYSGRDELTRNSASAMGSAGFLNAENMSGFPRFGNQMSSQMQDPVQSRNMSQGNTGYTGIRKSGESFKAPTKGILKSSRSSGGPIPLMSLITSESRTKGSSQKNKIGEPSAGMTKLCVTNLPPNSRWIDIKQFFNDHLKRIGAINPVQVVRKNNDRTSATVSFQSAETAFWTLQNMNGIRYQDRVINIMLNQ